ncbi:hypothetical protein B4U80_14092, partial [Leptotrombidium deliense]
MPRSCGYEEYRRSVQLSVSARKVEYGEASSDDLSSDWDEAEEQKEPNKIKPSAWKKVRNVVHWSPFVQTYKKQKYPWIQLAGHQGNFRPGGQGTILKKLNCDEEKCFNELVGDSINRFVPVVKGKIVEPDTGE